ncbi:DUF3786 domain-containing protein [Thermanaeromonas sp. C210]|uniref:DUF3786 domain-containing protein n=1 Tax=Thermanaeromonas sp. C210 TaxID=2731925 RepID=UPI00155C8C1C|nr:DUF3786 domain-containing protein [Thermanaeromonas sp. C210]GFN23634.1 hypothetical protein TAMC210_19510 [Thermanaeromonas sp. C210]
MDRMPYNLNVTLELARERLRDLSPEEIAARKNVRWQEDTGEIHCPSLESVYRVRYPGGQVYGEGGGEVDTRCQVLILHYLASSGTSLQGRWISFKELPGGSLYQQPFYSRSVLPLVKTFGFDLEKFLAAGRALGGERATVGHAGMILYPFPLVPVCISLWAGDEEVPPNGTILFDGSAAEHLATEDYAVLAELLVRRLKAAAAG